MLLTEQQFNQSKKHPTYKDYILKTYKKYIIICKRNNYNPDKFEFWLEKHQKETYNCSEI